MPGEIDSQTVLIATEAFLAHLRREWVRMAPDEECPVKPLASYKPASRAALLRAIKKAIDAATPQNVKKVKERRL